MADAVDRQGFAFFPEKRGEAIGWRIEGFDYRVWIRVGQRPDGRLNCTELRLESDQEVTAKGLREIQLGKVMDTLAALMFNRGAKPPRRSDLLPLRAHGYYEEEGEPTYWHQIPEPRPRRTVITAEVLQEVAGAYRAEVKANPKTAVESLAKKRHQSRDNLRRLIRLARNAGFLGPAIPGKAGEQLPKVRRKP